MLPIVPSRREAPRRSHAYGLSTAVAAPGVRSRVGAPGVPGPVDVTGRRARGRGATDRSPRRPSPGGCAIDLYLGTIQIVPFLLFLTFYVPCISTFAAMLRTIGRREALFSVSLSVGAAVLIAGLARFALETLGALLPG